MIPPATPPAASARTPVLVVAGTHSGCGKTTVALALMAALTRSGLRVQPLKAGPDHIDPGLHAAVTGRPGWNLDGWMCGPEGVRRSFARAVSFGEPDCPPDIAVIEGVMGLFDGASARGGQGSTAEVAALLNASVLLVADVRGMSRSVAALVGGYARFDPALRCAGVVCNRAGGPGHRDLLREALAVHCPDVPLLGLLGRDEMLELPARHLGLAQAHEHCWTELSARLARWFEAGMADAGQNLDGLLARCTAKATPPAPPVPADTPAECATPGSVTPANGAPLPPRHREAHVPAHGRANTVRVRIGIARDAAFSFLYPENLFLLEAAGAELVFFSPLDDATLPHDLGGLLLPGGYPELYAARLAANTAMRDAVRALAARRIPVHGECGGFMYLLRSLTDAAGVRHAMTGCLPGDSRMDTRLRALGYRETHTLHPSPFGPAGTVLRGHEFHYSHLAPLADPHAVADAPHGTPPAQPLWTLRDRNDAFLGPEGLCRGSVSGSYVHLHFGSNPDAARAFVANCAARGGIPCP